MCGRDQRGRTDVNGWVEGDDGVLLRFISIVPLLVLLSAAIYFRLAPGRDRVDLAVSGKDTVTYTF